MVTRARVSQSTENPEKINSRLRGGGEEEEEKPEFIRRRNRIYRILGRMIDGQLFNAFDR